MVGCWISILFYRKAISTKIRPWDMGIYPMAISQSEHDKFPWGRIKLHIQHSKPEKFVIFVISNNTSFISQNLKVVEHLRGKFDFFSPSGFETQSDFHCRTSKIKFYSVRALKCYLNEKSLIHGRVTATIQNLVHRCLKRTLGRWRSPPK